MCYREESIECVKDHVLQIHKQIYAKYNDDFDRIYTEGYNSKSYTGRVIEPGKIYELSYLECTCPKVKYGLRNHPLQCECSRQSILYILSQLEPDSHFEVRIENTILRGSDRCTFRITRHEGYWIKYRLYARTARLSKGMGRRGNAIRHKTMLLIPEIWSIPQQSVFLQHQKDKFPRYETRSNCSNRNVCYGGWFVVRTSKQSMVCHGEVEDSRGKGTFYEFRCHNASIRNCFCGGWMRFIVIWTKMKVTVSLSLNDEIYADYPVVAPNCGGCCSVAVWYSHV